MKSSTVRTWDSQPPYTAIDRVDAVPVDDTFRYVPQREVFLFGAPNTPNFIGSEGFTKCSALILQNTVHADLGMFTHLEPFAYSLHNDYLHTGTATPRKWLTTHKATFIYGSLSSRQHIVEELFTEQFFGPTEVQIIEIESGEQSWGVIYDTTNQMAHAVRRSPDQTVHTFQL